MEENCRVAIHFLKFLGILFSCRVITKAKHLQWVPALSCYGGCWMLNIECHGKCPRFLFLLPNWCTWKISFWTELWMACIISIIYNKEANHRPSILMLFPETPTGGTWQRTIPFYLEVTFLLEWTQDLGFFSLSSMSGAQGRTLFSPAGTDEWRRQKSCMALRFP